jgi:hypothetical protein
MFFCETKGLRQKPPAGLSGANHCNGQCVALNNNLRARPHTCQKAGEIAGRLSFRDSNHTISHGAIIPRSSICPECWARPFVTHVCDKKGSVGTLPLIFTFLFLKFLLHALADFRFVDRHIEVFDRLHAMSVIVMGRLFQMVLGGAHGFESFMNMGMRRRHWYGGGSRSWSYCGRRRHGSLRPGCRCREGQRKEKCCHGEQS